jgi:hypothetical protein
MKEKNGKHSKLIVQNIPPKQENNGNLFLGQNG